MIQLHPDYLLFELPNGDSVPCSAETVTFELIGEAAENLDPELIKNAAAAVLHYFQQDLKRECVSVGEFSEALEEVLRGFGLNVQSAAATEPAKTAPSAGADLAQLVEEAGEDGDLFFFQRLRAEVRRQVTNSPEGGSVNLTGLRPCVKRLLRARRWSRRCEGLSDRIVSYVRGCLCHEPPSHDCAVIIR